MSDRRARQALRNDQLFSAFLKFSSLSEVCYCMPHIIHFSRHIKTSFKVSVRIKMAVKAVCLLVCVIFSSLLMAFARRGVSVPDFSIRPPMLDRGRITYKTTYACEGNPLHLSCDEEHSIHLVRANYGRISISICNDGGRLDLSVNCMSYRSFLIMQDRCSQKSNCSVVVSSAMFGDPCPGTLKYLEVQYHCVLGGASSDTTVTSRTAESRKAESSRITVTTVTTRTSEWRTAEPHEPHRTAVTTTRRPPERPPMQFYIPNLISPQSSNNNNSLLLPSVQPTTIAPNEDVAAIITTEAEMIAPNEDVIAIIHHAEAEAEAEAELTTEAEMIAKHEASISLSWSFIAISFAVFNIILAILVSFFCVYKTDNIQHHRLIRSLPFMAYCFEDINCSNAKTSVSNSDNFNNISNRPVVTQVTATQVAIVSQQQQHQQLMHQHGQHGQHGHAAHAHQAQHSQLQLHFPQQPTYYSPSQLTSFRPQLLNSPQEKDSCFIRHDPRYISVQRETDGLLLNNNEGTTGPILVNPINSVPTVNVTIGDISAAALSSQNLADFECKLQMIRSNSLSRQPKARRKIRGNHLDNGSRNSMHSVAQSHVAPHFYNQYIDHIYESIDSDSLSSGVYERHIRYGRRSPTPFPHINDFYAGVNVTINPTNVIDDNWSQNSSSSYGPLYDDRRQLIGSQSINNSPHLNMPLISQEHRIDSHHYHSNLNIYDKSKAEIAAYRNASKLKDSNKIVSNDVSHQSATLQSNTQWNIYPESSESNHDLPDLIQNPIDISNNVTTLMADANKVFNKHLKDYKKTLKE